MEAKKDTVATGGDTMSRFVDTGDWKLLIYISSRGMTALLRSLDSENPGCRLLFSEKWDAGNTSFLPFVETLVYDHPQILDDFSTEIIIQTPKALWVPSALLENDEKEDEYLNCVYDCEPEDIFTDLDESESCLYTSVHGLNSFLNRTLPGCRISSHISVLKKHFEKERSEWPRIIVNIREDEADVLAFKDSALYCTATFPWKEASDIAYRVFLTTDAYSFPNNETRVEVYSNSAAGEDLAGILEKFVGEVKTDGVPRPINELDIDLSLALRL